MKILFAGGGTGGHLYPGLAIARAIVRRRPDARPFFVGAKRGVERDVLPTTEFPHLLLDLHPLYRPQVWKNWRTLVGAISAWRALDEMRRTHDPVVVVGTGGYAAGVASLWAWRRGIPLVQHIGDAVPGLTARWSARLKNSREAYLGYPEAERLLPHTGCVYHDTGNPIEPPPDIRPGRAESRARWGFPASALVLLVFGGSQGARAINRVVAAWVERGLPKGVCVLWATGRAHYDTYKALDRPDVRVLGYISPIAEAYAAADVALVRGGMMGSSELSAWGIPMLIVPLPSAAQDHQTANAKVLEAAGAARHLPEGEFSPARIDAELGALIADRGRLAEMATAARLRGRPHAADEIAGRVIDLVRRMRDAG